MLRQTVKDLLTMNVGAVSQNGLRMSFVPEHNARTFDIEVIAFWSQLIKRDARSCAASCCCPMASSAVGSPKLLSQPLSLQTQTTSSLPHHNSVPSLCNYRPYSHNR